MATHKLTRLKGREVLDSRGNPALEVEAFCGRISETAIVPSGASTGIYEALELRDKDERFNGKGVREAIKKVSFLSKKLKRINIVNQKKIDSIMLELDGTAKKTKLGGKLNTGSKHGMLPACCKMQGEKSLHTFIKPIRREKSLPTRPILQYY